MSTARLLLQVLDETTMTWNATTPSLKAVRVCVRRVCADCVVTLTASAV